MEGGRGRELSEKKVWLPLPEENVECWAIGGVVIGGVAIGGVAIVGGVAMDDMACLKR